jgi:hypothetical protein
MHSSSSILILSGGLGGGGGGGGGSGSGEGGGGSGIHKRTGQTSMQAGRLQAVGRADQTSDEHGLGLATTAAAEAVRRHLEEERERERV